MSRIDTLLPKKLSQDDASYKTVEDLDAVLRVAKEQHIKNVALTGPFGSGKSSVLFTLMNDFQSDEREYLPISLATLQANEEQREVGEEKKESDEETRKIENLNRKIEYSILQQIIYREKADTVPNSRFRRIVHLPKKNLRKYAAVLVLTVLSVIILFEPSFLKVDSLYQLFNFGYVGNTIFDACSAIWLIYALYYLCTYILKSYSNSKLNKLNLKDGEIEIVEDNSIFNKHLDEILYFFQVTKYNVVIIEDLDRFGTPNIFLKLRELNQLVNESKIVGRHITFVYAIKDDVFKDEDRTKFFDYITTVIPVINPSNSKDKLKQALKEKGFLEDEIPDDDLSEIAFFIQDMRILTNIVNEYKQYREKLCSAQSKQLSFTKLLAMIVYKNYFPQDFAQLHRREGKVYACISKKRDFIGLALKAVEEKKEKLTEREKLFQNSIHVNQHELRLLLLYKLKATINDRLKSITIDGTSYSLETIAGDDSLFQKIISSNKVNYWYYYGYSDSTSTSNIDIKSIDKSSNYLSRIAALEDGLNYFKKESRILQREEIEIKSLRLKDLINRYNLSSDTDYVNLGLSPMQDVFLRRGFIDEEYYDYISYFYEGMMSLSDRDLLLSMKQQIAKPYDYHIDKVANFAKELKSYMFEHESILNIDLLDYLAKTSMVSTSFENFMVHIEGENIPYDFLAEYYTYGKQQQGVFNHIIQWNPKEVWNGIVQITELTIKNTLIEAYLKYNDECINTTQIWLNENYEYLVSHFEGIGLERCIELVVKSKFDSINGDNDDLLDCVIAHDCYTLTTRNMFVVLRRLMPSDTLLSENRLNYTRITATNNTGVINYINNNISEALECLRDEDKDESVDTILFILNNENLDGTAKEKHLKRQVNHLSDFTGITDKTMYEVAVKNLLISPTWENVLFYYGEKQLSNELVSYIEHFNVDLAATKVKNEGNANNLFIDLFASSKLAPDAYSLLQKSFDYKYVLDNCDQLVSLNQDRLKILIDNDRIPFNQSNIAIINQTEALAYYIGRYYMEFRQNTGWDYKWDESLALMVLLIEEKRKDNSLDVVRAVPATLRKLPRLANVLAAIYMKTDDTLDEEESVTLSIIKNCSEEKNSVALAIRYIKSEGNDFDVIDQVLCTLGNKYEILANKNKRPTFQGQSYELDLLSYLKSVGYISSYKQNKDGYKVYHSTTKE